MHRTLLVLFAGLGLAGPQGAAGHYAPPWPNRQGAPMVITAEPLPGVAHWRCWQSFGTVRGFDECDSSAVISLGGLPAGTRRVSMRCLHELHYIATRQVAGNAAMLGVHDQTATTVQTVEVQGRQAYVSVGAHIGLPADGATPIHYWDGAVSCSVVGTLP